MADSWLDLGSNTDKFLIGNDWATSPSQSLEPYRTIIQYSGTGISIRNISDFIQIKIGFHFTNMSKTDEYNILSFFNSHRGRLNAFWLPIPKNYWTLALDTAPTDPYDLTLKNYGTPAIRAYDRLFILLNTGDYISRKIAGFDDPILSIQSPLDRVVSVGNINIFGKLIYCRFDQDEIQIHYISPGVSECDLSFIELPKEYPV